MTRGREPDGADAEAAPTPRVRGRRAAGGVGRHRPPGEPGRDDGRPDDLDTADHPAHSAR